jgi:predicted alpha-1,2-mannosidase
LIVEKTLKVSLRLLFALVPVFLFAPGLRGQHAADPAANIDPLLGVAGGGNVFPGPVVPFGMIKPGPDMAARPGHDANAGWNEKDDIRGFSQTHVSGTGGGAKYGNILVEPTTGVVAPMDSASPRADEKASAGLYQVTLARYNLGVDIAASRHSAIYRFHYPAGAQANLLFDVAHCLYSGGIGREEQALATYDVKILSPTEVAGSTSVTGGWNKQPNNYTVYFFARTDMPAATSSKWTGSYPRLENEHSDHPIPAGGAWFTFGPATGKPVLMKIGISFVSIEQARRNLEAEIPGFDFEATRMAAVAEWNRALATVELKGESSEQAQVFYTALYHTMLMPTDRSGENPLWKSGEPYYDDYYAIWDIFRTSGPLLTLIAPERQTAIVRSLVDIYRHEGWLPDARSGNYNGRTQGGSNAEFMITDAYLKGLKGIDWKTAYAAEVNDAEVSPADHFKEGRGGLDDWHKRGYVSIEGSDRSGSVHMEYAADDFEIALLAKGLGKQDDYEKYRARSANWKNLWDADFTVDGFKGFIRPRHRDGSWLEPFSAMMSGSWNGNTFYEGNSWTYSTFVPQDVPALIRMSGGAQTFVDRLDAFFAVPERYDVGNEPGFLTPYLYNWAGRPDKTAAHVRAIIAASYHAGPTGLPGNDDSGAMSSWYAFGQMGIFPNAGQDLYLIGSPAYPETKLHLAGGKTFTIEARGVSAENIYVGSATLNGKLLNRAWLRHAEIADGGRLVLTMSAKPGNWAQHDLPPAP